MTNNEQRIAALKAEVDGRLVDVDFAVKTITEDAAKLADLDPTEAFVILGAEVKAAVGERPEFMAEVLARFALNAAKK